MIRLRDQCVIAALAFLAFGCPITSRADDTSVKTPHSASAMADRVDQHERLLEAADTGNFKVVRQAIQGGADVNSSQENGWTALMLACQGEHVAIVQYLLTHGADPRRRSKLYNDVDALALAVQSGNIAITKMLLDHGSNINEIDDVNCTPLMGVLGNGNLPPPRIYRMVKFLLRNGANVTATSSTGLTALSMVEGRIKIAGYIRETRPDVLGLESIRRLLQQAIARRVSGRKR